MASRIEIVEHKGKQVIVVDFSHLDPEGVLEVVEDVKLVIEEQAPNSVLALADYTGAQLDKPAAQRIKEVLVLDRPYVKRSAWVGTAGLPKVFFENFKTFSQREFPEFKTREEALDWLVSGS